MCHHSLYRVVRGLMRRDTQVSPAALIDLFLPHRGDRDLLSRHGLGVVVAVGVSTLLTLAVTALVFRAVAGRAEPEPEAEESAS